MRVVQRTDGGRVGSPSGSSPAVTGTVTVFAAASLKEAFTTLGQQFEAAHPGTRVVLNFGPSSGLATQINQGAPADVFASASAKNMDQVVSSRRRQRPADLRAQHDGDRRTAGQPGRRHLASPTWPGPGVKVALCQPQVPVRRHGRDGVRPRRRSGHPGHPGGRRQVGARQGHPRRGRRRRRLRHRRQGGRRQVKGVADPGGRQRLDHLPHRPAHDGAEHGGGAGVHRLRAVRRRRRRADRRRLRPP